MIRDFIAIDFETANQQPSSVCSVGVVMVRDGQIVDSFYSLIQIGVSGYMASHKMILRMHQFFPKYGSNWRNEL